MRRRRKILGELNIIYEIDLELFSYTIHYTFIQTLPINLKNNLQLLHLMSINKTYSNEQNRQIGKINKVE